MQHIFANSCKKVVDCTNLFIKNYLRTCEPFTALHSSYHLQSADSSRVYLHIVNTLEHSYVFKLLEKKVFFPFRKIMSAQQKREDILLLFDVDGTLTFPRSVVQPEFEDFFYTKVKPRATIGIVGGSDLEKMFEQLNGKKILDEFDFIFPENGLVQIDAGKEVGKQNIIQHLGEKTLQRFLNYVLRYLSELELPIKRGTFIEFRNGMMNVCPIGRQCSREERNMFAAYDDEHQVRAKMIAKLKEEFADVDLTYSIGGQISFDVFPHGWDKTYSLRYIEANYKFKEIHFFGDKTEAGGNDHEIYIDPRVVGHKVSSPHDTQRILSEILNL